MLAKARLDLLHLHGIWQFPSHAAGAWARETGRPLLLSPHGMLDPWITSRNRWKKLPARFLWEHHAWRSASACHALTEAEAQDIGREIPGARTVVIPNIAPAPGPVRDRMPPPGALYIGRIHEKKNIGALIEAWRSVQGALPPDAQLTIAGWGDDESVDALNRTLSADDRSIQFVGTVFEAQKAALFDVSRFVVLPTQSEGLPVTMLEAWAAGTPTIMTEACHLPEGYEAGAALRCAPDPAGIGRSLVEAFGKSTEEWMSMSRAAQELARSTFGSERVTDQWSTAYATLLTD